MFLLLYDLVQVALAPFTTEFKPPCKYEFSCPHKVVRGFKQSNNFILNSEEEIFLSQNLGKVQYFFNYNVFNTV